MAPVLAGAWGHLDPAHLSATLPRFSALVAAVVHRFSPAAATLAVRHYEAERRRAGIVAPYRARPAAAPPIEQIGKTVSWATQPLWAATPETEPKVLEQAKQNLAGAVDKLVLDVGRTTIIDNVAADAKAKAWARVPEPGCCYFCALLATRGAVYDAHSVQFRTHDHCRCHAEPVFNAYEPTAQIRQWQALYAEAAAGTRGMKATQKAWRKAFDAQA